MALVPAPPYDDRPINPYNKINCGVSYGICKPNGTSFDHSMWGTLAGTDTYFRRSDICSLTPWGIGGPADGAAMDGKIYRWMDYDRYRDVQPWSSGPWIAPGTGDGLAFVQKYGVSGINGYAQAIETSDGGNRQLPMSAKQWMSLIWLKAYLAHKYGITSDEIRSALAFMHHREICILSGKDCPFPRIYNHTVAYLGAIETLMQFFEGKISDLNRLVFTIAGLTVDMRHVGRLKGGIVTPPATPGAPKPAPAWVGGASVRARKEILARQAPSTTYKVVMVIKGGEFAKLVDGSVRSGSGLEWVDVVTVNGTGWVPKNDLELASPATAPGPIFEEYNPQREFEVDVDVVNVRRYGGTDHPILFTMPRKRRFLADGHYIGEKVGDEDRWVVMNNDPRGRVWMGALKRIK